MMKWFILVIFSILIYLHLSHLLFFNIYTHSLPHGIYIQKDGAPQRGDYAVSCLTNEIAQYGIRQGYLVQGNCQDGFNSCYENHQGSSRRPVFVQERPFDAKRRAIPTEVPRFDIEAFKNFL